MPDHAPDCICARHWPRAIEYYRREEYTLPVPHASRRFTVDGWRTLEGEKQWVVKDELTGQMFDQTYETEDAAQEAADRVERWDRAHRVER